MSPQSQINIFEIRNIFILSLYTFGRASKKCNGVSPLCFNDASGDPVDFKLL